MPRVPLTLQLEPLHHPHPNPLPSRGEGEIGGRRNSRPDSERDRCERSCLDRFMPLLLWQIAPNRTATSDDFKSAKQTDRTHDQWEPQPSTDAGHVP